jgi:hypothetical protein
LDGGVVEGLALIADVFDMFFNELGQSPLVVLLPADQLPVEFQAAHLVDGHLVHLGQVLAHFGAEPVVEPHQVDVHVVDVFELVCFEVFEVSGLHASKSLEIAAILASKSIDLSVCLFHGQSDSGNKLVVEEELFQPEGRVDELAHVFAVPVATTDDIIPLFKFIDEDVDSVAPVLDTLLYAALLEEGHQYFCKFLFEGSDFYHFFGPFKLTNLVGLPVVEVELKQCPRCILIQGDQSFLRHFGLV